MAKGACTCANKVLQPYGPLYAKSMASKLHDVHTIYLLHARYTTLFLYGENLECCVIVKTTDCTMYTFKVDEERIEMEKKQRY